MLNVFSLENAHIFRKTSLLELGFEILALYLYVSLSITQPDFHCNCLKEREKLKRIDRFESNKSKIFFGKKKFWSSITEIATEDVRSAWIVLEADDLVSSLLIYAFCFFFVFLLFVFFMTRIDERKVTHNPKFLSNLVIR